MTNKLQHGGKRTGAGRKPKPPDSRLMPKTVRLSVDQIAHCTRDGRDLAKSVRELIDRDRA